MSEHQEFVELCALYTSACISDDQLRRLDQHLKGCMDCRRALEEFQEIASMGLPALAPEFAALPADGGPEGAEDRAQRRLLARIEIEIATRRAAPAVAAGQPAKDGRRSAKRLFIRNLLPYAAALVLTSAVGIYSFHLGAFRGRNASEPGLKQAQARAKLIEGEATRLSEERQVLNAKLQESDGRIEALMKEVSTRAAEISALREQGKQLQQSVQHAEEKRAGLDVERTDLNRRLAEVQAALDTAQRTLDGARSERAADVAQVADLERRLDEASASLKDRDQTIQQQRELLAYDRDIRELIAARDLYVAEVSDVDRNARTKAPFGRVFYTKGRSLVFYAYDLDRQAGLKRAAAFQAWGRRGPDFQQALPLGILYLDNPSNRRWVLRFDDPKTIAKIDAVFVTVEPKGGSQKPTGAPLLFTYLNVTPNHP